jgi:naphthoate synthase/2-ketocyclohexanecarboxyl-CoA hydrolase
VTTWTAWQSVEGWSSTEVLFEKKYRTQGGGVARVLMNRPEVMNAFTIDHTALMNEAVRAANVDPTIGVIVISGAGDHFGVGGDVRWEAEGGLRPEQLRVPASGSINEVIGNVLKPVIAAVKGYCIGGSNHLAYFCDFTIAADTAIFGQNGPRVASPAHGEIVSMLAHVVGLKRAKEIWMLCRQYTAQQALEMGLCNAVVPLDRLEAEVDQWCDELLNLMPECLAIVKQSFEEVGSNLHAEYGRLLGMIAPDFHDRPGVKEAQQAFFERRTPNFWAGKLPAGVAP